MVAEPDAPDHQEAREVRQVLRPLLLDPVQEVRVVAEGTPRSRTSSVIAMANTPSLNASTLLVDHRLCGRRRGLLAWGHVTMMPINPGRREEPRGRHIRRSIDGGCSSRHVAVVADRPGRRPRRGRRGDRPVQAERQPRDDRRRRRDLRRIDGIIALVQAITGDTGSRGAQRADRCRQPDRRRLPDPPSDPWRDRVAILVGIWLIALGRGSARARVRDARGTAAGVRSSRSSS